MPLQQNDGREFGITTFPFRVSKIAVALRGSRTSFELFHGVQVLAGRRKRGLTE
jgi:Na+/H+ antiporter NhaA